MKHAVFEIKQNATGRYYFIYRDCLGKEIVISKSFVNRSGVETCIAQIREQAKVAAVCTIEDCPATPPCFIVGCDSHGYAFSLLGFDNEVVFSSLRFPAQEACLQGIALLKAFSLDAKIIDSV